MESVISPDLALRASVIIPALDAMATIDDQLDGLAEQRCEFPFEVLVCDNGSTDGLRAHIESHPHRNRLRLRRIDASSIRGISHARNRGACEATGEFLAFCDADDRAHPDWLAHLVTASKDADLVSGALETESINTSVVDSWRPMVPSPEPYGGRFLPFALGANFGVRAAAYEAVGGSDESLTGGGEDVDLSWRLQLAGWAFTHEHRAVMAYRVRPSRRALWRQVRKYGMADVELFSLYRDYGLRTGAKAELFWYLVTLVINNPLLPQRVAKISRGRWLALAAYVAGTVQGSARHRTFYF